MIPTLNLIDLNIDWIKNWLNEPIFNLFQMFATTSGKSGLVLINFVRTIWISTTNSDQIFWLKSSSTIIWFDYNLIQFKRLSRSNCLSLQYSINKLVRIHEQSIDTEFKFKSNKNRWRLISRTEQICLASDNWVLSICDSKRYRKILFLKM